MCLIIYCIFFSCFSGTGKTLLARAVASQLDCNFLKVVSSSIVDKYIGESARLIREMFNYARDHQPCIIFMDEIDAIGTWTRATDYRNQQTNWTIEFQTHTRVFVCLTGGRRFSEGTSADREIQRTLMEVSLSTENNYKLNCTQSTTKDGLVWRYTTIQKFGIT